MNKKNIVRVIFYVLGMIIIALGVSLTIISTVGTGAWDAVSTGLFQMFGLSVGIWVMIVAVMLVIFSGIILKRIPRLTTLITSLLIGVFIDLWLLIVIKITVNHVMMEWFTFLFGITMVSLGAALYLVSDLPPSPIDYFMMSVKERFNVSMGVAKIMSEGVGVMIGLLVGGPIGLGTIIITLIMGYMIETFLKIVRPIFNKWTY